MRGIYLAAFKVEHPNHNIVYQDINGKRDIGGDMMDVDLSNYDFVIASPPCNYWSIANYRRETSKYSRMTKHLLPSILNKLCKLDKSFISEKIITVGNYGKGHHSQDITSEKELITKDGNIKRYIGSDKVDKFKDGQMATTTFPNGYGHGPRTHNESIALNTIDRPIVKNDLRIRKLVPVETMKLMGFTRKDTQAMREIGLSDAAIYHCAGDSIVSTVLIGIFSNLLNELNSHEKIINDYVEKEIL